MIDNIGLEGFLLINKPYGITSHQVINKIRKKLFLKKIGHTGTLDPLAEGLLLIMIGKTYTKMSQKFLTLDKDYEATILLGVETSTYDAQGSINNVKKVNNFSKEEIECAMNDFKGIQSQTPPIFSAKKYNGKPLYFFARKGLEVNINPNVVNVYEFKLLSMELPYLKVYLKCSKGCYVRSIAHDLGKKIGCGAHITSLTRTKIGKISIENSIDLDFFNQLSIDNIKKNIKENIKLIDSIE